MGLGRRKRRCEKAGGRCIAQVRGACCPPQFDVAEQSLQHTLQLRKMPTSISAPTARPAPHLLQQVLALGVARDAEEHLLQVAALQGIGHTC